MGLRRRITIGFFSLVALLLFAVAIGVRMINKKKKETT